MNARSLFRPPPRLSLSEWADRHFRLSSVSSAEPGQWYTSRAEYQRGILDSITDPAVQEVTVMSSAQIGKTSIELIALGFFIDQDPSPVLVVLPTIEMAETWSKNRLAPMLRDTPVLRDKVQDPRSRDSGNTLREKTFPGGVVILCGANAPAGLSSRPIRVVLFDEVDRFPPSAGTEGDPVRLGEKRTQTFWNRKLVKVSSPTIRGASRIEDGFEKSDKRYYEVPCPSCGVFQVLKWGHLRWEKDDKGQPVNVRYECEACGASLTEKDKPRMIRSGQWVIAAPHVRGHAGFWINELYSPWSTWQGMAEGFLAAKKNREQLQTFVNTSLAETWEESGEGADDEALRGRREDYGEGDPLPEGVLLLTVGADVQDDRIEADLYGWGLGQESWVIEHATFRGNPATSQQVWRDLDDWLLRVRPSGDGTALHVAAACIDSGGHATDQVYAFCRKREHRRVWAIIGRGGVGLPLIRIATKRNKAGVALGTVGVDTAKDLIFARLQVEEFGPGHIHFARDLDNDWFRQLTAEQKVRKQIKGQTVLYWKKIRARNEALDCAVYASAAFSSLNANLEKIAQRREQQAEAAKQEPEPPEHPASTKAVPRVTPIVRKGWSATRW